MKVRRITKIAFVVSLLALATALFVAPSYPWVSLTVALISLVISSIAILTAK